MKMNKLFFILAILLQLQSVLNAKTRFSDRQVATMIPKYFARDHNSPLITRTRVYAEDGGKVLHLDIEVNRNRFGNPMEYALSAMASVARYALRPFDKFLLIMVPNSRQFDIGKVDAKAKCTLDYFVFKKFKNDRWSKQCVKIEKI